MTDHSTFDEDDGVLQFRFEDVPVRGRAVRLASSLERILAVRRYPPNVEGSVAEICVLTALIGNLIHPGWKFSIQVRSQAPLRLLASDYLAPANAGEPAKIRALATFAENISSDSRLRLWQGGSGYFGVLIDRQDGKLPFQGMAPLEQSTLAGCAEDYFRRSQQIPTQFAVAVGKSLQGGVERWRGGGIVIQRMPTAPMNGSGQDEDNGDVWTRACALLQTVDELELTGPSTPMLRVLFNLFQEDAPRAGPLQKIEFGCTVFRGKSSQGHVHIFPRKISLR